MTAEQFAALAELLRLRAGPAKQAAYLVLVEGLGVSEAARSVGIEYQAAHKAAARARRGVSLAKKAIGKNQEN